MTDPSLAVQTAIRATLVALNPPPVDPSAILDKSILPSVFPCIIIGDGQVVSQRVAYRQTVFTVFCDAVIWTKEDNLVSVKLIAGPVSDALTSISTISDEWKLIDAKPASIKYMRDPNSEISRAIVSVEYVVEKV